MTMARSYLFVPAERPDRFLKALASGAHQVILDLEDAVAADAKPGARTALSQWLRETYPSLPTADQSRLIIRINAGGTPWHDDDVALLAASPIRRVMVPKAERAEPLHDLAAQCGRGPHGEGIEMIALVETVVGVVHLREIAHCAFVTRLAFGTFDYAVDAGLEVGAAREGEAGPVLTAGRPFDMVRAQLVLESRYANLAPPIDGVTLATGDIAQIAADVADARRFGFGGKLCIHPNQVAPVDSGFAPSPDERAWAERVMAALATNPRGAITVDGKMVDKPVVDRARRVLAS